MAKAKDVTGQKFGELTAISISGKDNFGRNKWLFLCNCGNTTEASLNNVLTGITKSCGCLKSKPNRRIDLTGKRFGKLLVVTYSQTKNGNAYWECLCDCGNTSIVRYVKLARGYTKSCGCIQKEFRLGEYSQKNLNSVANWAKNIKIIHGECAKCGKTSDLHAHHINPYNQYKNQRTSYTNGISLCKNCHINFHSLYGVKNIGCKELGEYLGMNELTTKVLTIINNKNGKEDLLKARHYIDMLLELEYEE